MRIRYATTPRGTLEKQALVYTKEEHRITLNLVDPDAVMIVTRLKSFHYETYIVGGAVRDLLIGKKPKDFDIVTNATPHQIKRIFRNSRIIGKRFRLVHVYVGNKIFEVATFRSIKDGHTGNTYGTIEEDVLRRDFTLNALFYDPVEEVVLDFVGGVEDIRNRRLKAIIPRKVIFKDDPVRMIRAVKYAVMTGFSIPWYLAWQIRREAPLLDTVSPSRRTEEMSKIVSSGYAYPIIEGLFKYGLYHYLQPRAAELCKKDRLFKQAYFASLQALDKKVQEAGTVSMGDALVFLIRSYVEITSPWDKEKENLEVYRDTFREVRQFIMPLNPPRLALEQALRLLFRQRGIVVKKHRLPKNKKGTPSSPELFKEEQEGDHRSTPSPSERPRRKKRRRKGKKTPLAEHAPI
ncbi:MAG: polynucleotide adenylyltransferase PcnB [Treponemataceae bacterium]|nr:polynucleotide adenylyltransferase PcnB [Treponemataceae bacterium]